VNSFVQVTICQVQVSAIQALTDQIDQLDRQLRQRVARLAPSLLGLPGCGSLTAAKLIAETAGVALRGLLCHARWGGTGPGQLRRTDRHRLSRGGNRQLNAALHRIAITQLRLSGPGRTYYQRRRAHGRDWSMAARRRPTGAGQARWDRCCAGRSVCRPADGRASG
jgi:transposase